MRVNVFAAALNQTPLDWQGNQRRILEAIQDAKGRQAHILLLPELCIPGYGCEDMFLSQEVIVKSWKSLQEIIPQTQDLICILGLPVAFESETYNCAAVVQNGKLIGINAKKSLAHTGVYYEPRWFHPWTAKRQVTHFNIPFGDLVYQFGEVTCGLEICEDAWIRKPYPLPSPVNIVFNPSASNFELGKDITREKLVCAQAKFHDAFYVYTNLVGLESGRIIYDGSILFADPKSLLHRQEKRFGFKEVYLTGHTLETKLKAHGEYVKGEMLDVKPAVQVNHNSDESQTSPYLEFLFAEALGLYDYLRKTGANGYVVSLSGGRDSSCIAILVAQMLKLAEAELGPQQPLAEVLTCLYQSTEHSSEGTLNAARNLCAELNIKLLEFDIQPAVDHYLKSYINVSGKDLSWSKDNKSLQNVQARSRVQLPWLVANTENKVLLTTTNRSEVSAGYMTMDGDSAGGLAPIADIDKAFINLWLKWVMSEYQIGIAPVKALADVLAIEATAELQPPEMNQRDEQDLMPFPILNKIEELYVFEKLPVEKIELVLIAKFPQHDPDELRNFVAKFQKMWKASQWKRERLAPSFHIDRYSLDPKTWCRYPIISGKE